MGLFFNFFLRFISKTNAKKTITENINKINRNSILETIPIKKKNQVPEINATRPRSALEKVTIFDGLPLLTF